MVKLVQETVAPDTMLVVFRLRSHPDVPTLPSMITVVPLDAYARNQAAVPVLAASVSELIVLAVAVTIFEPAEPEATAGEMKAVEPKVRVDSRVWLVIAVFASVGCDPE